MMIESIQKNKNKILVIIFLLIFFIGNSVVKDYGVSSDESDQRHSGFIELNYVGKILLPNLTEKLSQNTRDKLATQLAAFFYYFIQRRFRAPLLCR